MIETVIHNVRPREPHRLIVVALREHLEQTGLVPTARARGARLRDRAGGRRSPQGAACTVLLARDLIDSDEPLMIANSDQWVDVDINDYLRARWSGARPTA